MSENTSHTRLAQKEVNRGLNKLLGMGITPGRWRQMLAADPITMQRLIAAWPGAPVFIPTDTGIVYDATAVNRILGIPAECSDPVPQAAGGEIVVYYGGWDMQTLRLSPAGKKQMWQDQDWYDKYGWKAEPGYYRLLLPVPNSNRRNCSEQLRLLASINTSWEVAPVCVAATALLVHLTVTATDLLRKDWCRCAEVLRGGFRVVLFVYEGRVGLYSDWGEDSDEKLWVSAARKV